MQIIAQSEIKEWLNAVKNEKDIPERIYSIIKNMKMQIYSVLKADAYAVIK